MEFINIKNSKPISRIGLGTWTIGGWGETNEKLAIAAIHKAIDKGINLIDTAPAYGFGTSETVVGKALKQLSTKDKVFIATKVGLNWKNKTVFRDCRKDRILKEIEYSLKRLQVESIDLYQIHWPDPLTPFDETAVVLKNLLNSGKIKAVGVSNFSIDQIEEFSSYLNIATEQSPFNIFENEIQNNVLEYCHEKNIVVLGYGAFCRGLLTHKIKIDTMFDKDDVRQIDPKFKLPRLEDYLKCVSNLSDLAQKKYNKSLSALAIRYVLDKNIDIALQGARKPDQIDVLDEVFGWKLTTDDLREIDQLVVENILEPVGPEFMAPASRLAL